MQISNVGQTNSSFYLSKNADCAEKNENRRTIDNDTVSLSGNTPKRTALPIRIADLLGFDPHVTGSISIDDLYEHGMDSLNKFNDKLNQLMNEHGIDTDISVDLKSAYGTGDVIVTSDHPDKEKIERLFKDDPELRNEFTRIKSALQIVQSAKDAIPFQEAYRQNPVQAVSQYSYLFNTHLEGTMKISNGDPALYFERLLNV